MEGDGRDSSEGLKKIIWECAVIGGILTGSLAPIIGINTGLYGGDVEDSRPTNVDYTSIRKDNYRNIDRNDN